MHNSLLTDDVSGQHQAVGGVGGLHSSMVSSAPTIVQPRVQIPSKQSKLSSIFALLKLKLP